VLGTRVRRARREEKRSWKDQKIPMEEGWIEGREKKAGPRKKKRKEEGGRRKEERERERKKDGLVGEKQERKRAQFAKH